MAAVVKPDLLAASKEALAALDTEWGGELTDGPGTVRHALRVAIAATERKNMSRLATEQRFCELLDSLLEANEDLQLILADKANPERLAQAQHSVRAARELVDRCYRRALEASR